MTVFKADKATIKLIRDAHRKNPHRESNLALAFARGMPHAVPEPRVRESNLPSVYGICSWYLDVVEPHAGETYAVRLKRIETHPIHAAIKAWCTMPEDRIVRWKPREKKMRRSNGRPEASA